VMDYEMCRGMIEPLNSPKKKSRVAIVGAGPAGLGCAAELAVRGHNVKVFDREEKPGGMLRYYIPNYRLPDEILDFEIDFIKKLGVEFEMKSEIENLESLKKDFDAVYIATGLHKSRGGDLKGVEKKNCYMALDFLRMANASKLPKLGNRVCVIGGGDTAMDAAQVSKKSGAESFVLYRRPQDKMPAYKNEIEASWNMGVEFYFRVLPCEIVGKDRVEGVKCVRVKWHKSLLGKGEKYDIENEEFTIACDTVVIAIGQGTESIFGLKQSKEGLLQIDSETFRTSENGIYAGGDMVQGGGTAARAVGMGKLAATKIDEYLK